jgi:alpha-L-fucosidase
VNGDAIYGTRPWEGSKLNREQEASLYFTKKGKDLFVICTEWPQQEFVIRSIKGSINSRVKMLGYEGNVQWQMVEDGMHVKPPAVTPATVPCDFAWVFKITDVLGQPEIPFISFSQLGTSHKGPLCP